MELKLTSTEILVLRDVRSDMTSYNGFKWPESGYVEAPEWMDTDTCGNGLHGLPWGEGGDYRIGGSDAKQLLVKVDTVKGYRHGTGDMTDKCKFHSGEVVFCGSLKDATDILQIYAPANTRINWATQTAGDASTQTAGNASTQTAGNDSTQKAGHYSTQTAGINSTQTAGNYSTQKAGNDSTQKAWNASIQTAWNDSTQTAGYASTQTAGINSTQKAGNDSTQTAGNASTQKAWNDSTQTAGDYSTQTAGNASTQTAGNASTQTAGNDSTQTAGINSVQIILYWDRSKYVTKCRVVTKEAANKPYKFYDGDWHLV
jgi:hypothetical protein